MSQIQFTNFAHTTLAAGITDTDTTISVAGGQGARFPVIVPPEYFYVTLENAGLQREIVKVTARSADTLTVVRGQDNTTAASWNSGDTLALRLNAAAMRDALTQVATGTVSIKRFSGDGVTTAFALDDAPLLIQNVDVFIGGMYQNHDTFTVSGVTLTFTEAPTEGTDNIEARVYLPVGAGAANALNVVYTPAGSGAVATNVQAKLREFVSVKDFSGVDPTGMTDSTAGLTAAFSNGGRFYVPEGDYLIAGTGPDSGGVEVTITQSMYVECHPNARFFTNSLDNDMLRFIVPSNGAGLPTDGIEFEWRGGIIDQRNQKTSTVVPFIATYPAVNPGTSATCDALSIRGDFTSGTVQHGIKRAVVVGLTTIAGDHWETAGGDGGIFMGGCASQETYYCRHVAARDLAQYFSSDTTGVLQCHVVAIGNAFENCFGALNSKRSNGSVTYQGNDINNCPRALAIEHEIGNGSNRVSIMGNTMRSCGILGRITYANGVSIIGNHASDHGALLADGLTIEGVAGCNGWQLRGVTRSSVSFNTMLGVKAAARAAYPASCQPLVTEGFNPGAGTVLTSSCVFMFNESDGWVSGGSDTGTNNSFIRNRATNVTGTAFIAFSGTGGYEERLDPTANTVSYMSALSVSDGTVALPGIARRTQANTGVFFAANAVGLSGGGTERIRATNTGLGFFGATPVARPVYITPTGTSSRATFDTATVTTAELAQRVKAMIEDLESYGLFG